VIGWGVVAAIAERLGHAAEAELTAISNAFATLKERRNKLLHANPRTAPLESLMAPAVKHEAEEGWS
jgi:hypothetical protein